MENSFNDSYKLYKREVARKLKKWDAEYNEDRLHVALKAKTSAERVHEPVPSSETAKELA